MIDRHCKSSMAFPLIAISVGAVRHYVCVLGHKNTSPWFLILESSRLIRECGFWGAVIERKLKEIKEIKAADKVQKIKHWGELKQTGKKWENKIQSCKYVWMCTHTGVIPLGNTEFLRLHRHNVPLIAADLKGNLAFNTGLPKHFRQEIKLLQR